MVTQISDVISDVWLGIVLILKWGLFLGMAYAFIDALTYPVQAYQLAGKLTKVVWLLFLGIAAAGEFFFGGPASILTVIGTAAMIVYLVDVRPALRSVTSRGRRSPTSHNWTGR